MGSAKARCCRLSACCVHDVRMILALERSTGTRPRKGQVDPPETWLLKSILSFCSRFIRRGFQKPRECTSYAAASRLWVERAAAFPARMQLQAQSAAPAAAGARSSPHARGLRVRARLFSYFVCVSEGG